MADGTMYPGQVKRGGKVGDRWTRQALPDLGTMRIIQHGVKLDGSALQNRSLYRRIGGRV